MNKKTKIAAAALISFLAAGLIAGCGGDKKAASSAASAAADGKKHVKVVLSSTERPLSWTDENGRTQAMNTISWKQSIRTSRATTSISRLFRRKHRMS